MNDDDDVDCDGGCDDDVVDCDDEDDDDVSWRVLMT